MDDKRLLATELTQYEPAVFTGDPDELPDPVGDTVLILPDTAAKMVGKLGLIEIPDDQRERYSKAAETGVIVKVGDGAFTWTADRSRPWKGYIPKVGDRVWFKRYSGVTVKGFDGEIYTIMTDHCIGAVMKSEDTDGRRNGSGSNRGTGKAVRVGTKG